MISMEAREYAKVLWDYHNVAQEPPSSVDLLLVTGSHDDRVAIYGAELARIIEIKALVTSGGFGKITAGTLSEPEGARFKRIMTEHGISGDRIISEELATNTGENLVNTRDLLDKLGIKVESGVIVTKPYMKRRALATAMKQWPDVQWCVAAPEIDFEAYPSDEVPEQRMIELMVGDLQRIRLYAEKGFQVHQHIPAEVWGAYEKLLDLGFDRQTIRR